MQLPTSFISRELFVSTLEALREQYVSDKINAEVIANIFKTEFTGVYDNSLLSKALIELLRMWFPPEEGECEIEFWAYAKNFGKLGDEYEDAGQLYDRLCRERNVTLKGEKNHFPQTMAASLSAKDIILLNIKNNI